MHVARDARSGHTPGQGRHPTGGKPRLLDQLRQALRSRHDSRRTEQTYCHWAKPFIYFHHIRHPAEMGEPEINAFLTHLAVQGKGSASTMVYTHVLHRGGRGVRSPADALME